MRRCSKRERERPLATMEPHHGATLDPGVGRVLVGHAHVCGLGVNDSTTRARGRVSRSKRGGTARHGTGHGARHGALSDERGHHGDAWGVTDDTGDDTSRADTWSTRGTGGAPRAAQDGQDTRTGRAGPTWALLWHSYSASWCCSASCRPTRRVCVGVCVCVCACLWTWSDPRARY